jgi:hypothetical protein
VRRAAIAAACLVLFGGRAFASDKPTVSSLAACPEWGAEKRGTPRALLHEVKHHVPPPGDPRLLGFDDIVSLQRQADARVRTGKGAAVTAKDRALLRDLDVRGGRVGEGDLVAVAGFVGGKPAANAGETVNCFLRGPGNNDFHFTLAPKPHGAESDGFVAEMVPQNRPKEWTLARLKKLADEGRQVLVAGQLMLDSIHRAASEPAEADERARLSIWEIHPVTKMLVCGRAANDCDPARLDDWQPLESVR